MILGSGVSIVCFRDAVMVGRTSENHAVFCHSVWTNPSLAYHVLHCIVSLDSFGLNINNSVLVSLSIQLVLTQLLAGGVSVECMVADLHNSLDFFL